MKFTHFYCTLLIVLFSTIILLSTPCYSSIVIIDPVYYIHNFWGGGQLNGINGIPGLNDTLKFPMGVTFSPSGDLYLVDRNSYIKVYNMTTGLVSTVVGTGVYSNTAITEGQLANQTGIGEVYEVAFHPITGELYYADGGYIRRVDSQGRVYSVAGTGQLTSTGDGGPALSATFHSVGIAFSPEGDLYIADFYNSVIRKIFTNGTIVSVCGNLGQGYNGDNIPANQAQIKMPSSIKYYKGDIYFSDRENGRLRMISSASGNISTIAYPVYSNDFVFNQYGDIFFAEMVFYRVRRFSKRGVFSSIAGDNNSGSLADNIPARSASVYGVWGLEIIQKTNELFFVDFNNFLVRKLTPTCPDNSTYVEGDCLYFCYGISSANATACSGIGSCIRNDTCSCPSGWRGNGDCSLVSCDDNCNGNGKCIGSNTCQCNSGWNGNSQCSAPSCEDVNGCSGHGLCVSNNTCICTSGWKGNLNCSAISCDWKNNCNGNGNCIGSNICQCNSGWNGSSECSASSCEDVNYCSGHGSCISNNTCLCSDGWKGNLNCSAVSCELLNNCNGNGQCIDSNTCQCNSGWNGNSQCSNFTCEGMNNCSGHGSCVSNNTCSCTSGWKGNSQCSSISCDLKNNCNGNGQCIDSNVCQCNSGWNGNSECSAPSCEDVNGCSGHGSCVSNNTCLCSDGWKGNSQCSSISCELLNNCNGNGKCIGSNTCQCNSGWKGNSQCSNFTCENVDNCSGHGSCVSNNTCMCDSGWRGSTNCSLISCDGLNNCSGHGSCVSNNTCSCNKYWRYVDCSINECLMSLDTSDNQLSCSSNTLSAAETFAQITTNVWTKQSLSLSGGNQLIKVSSGSTSSLDLSSNYFVSTSTTSSNSGFYTNVTNFMIQNSKSMLMNIKLSKPITYSFSNIDIDQTNYNFTCMRFNLDSNTWTNQDIDTTISSTTQISCSTQYVSSVAIKRSLLERSAPSTVSSGDLSIILTAILVPTFFLIMLFCSIAVFASIVMYIMNRMKKRKQNFSELPSQTNFELSNI